MSRRNHDRAECPGPTTTAPQPWGRGVPPVAGLARAGTPTGAGSKEQVVSMAAASVSHLDRERAEKPWNAAISGW